MLTVYHGATCEVKQPLCNAGRPNLDFGQGFYVTDLREQAVNWAQRQSEAWLNFIANSRKGLEPWRGYDFIEGGVADDRVVDTVNLYLLGVMTADVALNRLALHLPNNQMCLLNQSLVNECLHYVESQLLNNMEEQKG